MTESTAAVLDAAKALISVFGAHDTAAYFAGFSEDASFIFYYEDKPLRDLNAYRKEWKRWEDDHDFAVKGCRSLNQIVQFVTPDVAVFLHDVETDIVYDGTLNTRFERETILFRQQPDGRWLAVHEHLSKAELA
ncbi:DUF4440 domain-containing protein [Pseudomonas sp. 02C 26]|uniref:YybH family protein n=1 Tax=Pseudomonas sp. 02C 26 TaxID=2054914 RepID=UPI000C6D7D73|nr:nuclear transport factor 2 family protein [Pseudomonas sp. 02C 26]AUF96866.1 DUF4440 domain-containing protein [Pseudomonas sp. 02C 26]